MRPDQRALPVRLIISPITSRHLPPTLVSGYRHAGWYVEFAPQTGRPARRAGSMEGPAAMDMPIQDDRPIVKHLSFCDGVARGTARSVRRCSKGFLGTTALP